MNSARTVVNKSHSAVRRTASSHHHHMQRRPALQAHCLLIAARVSPGSFKSQARCVISAPTLASRVSSPLSRIGFCIVHLLAREGGKMKTTWLSVYSTPTSAPAHRAGSGAASAIHAERPHRQSGYHCKSSVKSKASHGHSSGFLRYCCSPDDSIHVQSHRRGQHLATERREENSTRAVYRCSGHIRGKGVPLCAL